MWEGGCRVVACIYSPFIKLPSRVSNDFMYVTDLLPTLAAVANITITDDSLDGFNQWETISSGASTPRKEILYNIENIRGFSGLMSDGWKIVNGTDNIDYATYMGSSGNGNFSFDRYVNSVLDSDASKALNKLDSRKIRSLIEEATVKCNRSLNVTPCNPLAAVCLFNIVEDPCESNNLAAIFPEKTNFLRSKLNAYVKTIVPSRRRFTDVNCDPENFNNTWNWWQDDSSDVVLENFYNKHEFLLSFLSFMLLAVLVCFLIILVSRNKKRSLKV